MAEVKQISAAQRAQNFAAATRQNFHMLPSQTVTEMGTTIQFTYPKARLLSKTFIKFDFDIDGLTPSTASNTNYFNAFYKLIRRISLSLNNGFEPFVISGHDLALMNLIKINPSPITERSLNMIKVENDKVSFVLELENTLNQRDASSLILLQNESTQVTLSIDFATDLGVLNSMTSGLTFTKCKTSVMLQTYTIPNYTEAFPDLSCLKLTKSRTQTLANGGEHILKLDVGTIYRKLVLYFTDENGIGVNVVNSNIELIYNTADTPISIDPEMLRMKNISDFGIEFPTGMYVFDFSGYAGFSNYGGSRDFVDTERLSEFWVRLSTSEGCKATIIQENLSRLR